MTSRMPPLGFGLNVQTWLQQQASFIGPVEKEREMMRVLFSIVYLVCAGLVLSIFWAIVSEKTRDFGILRSVGASREGVLWIFTRYGLMTGAMGSLIGLLLGTLVVNKINPIQDALARPPILLAVSSLVPCALALMWVLLRGGWRSVTWLLVNVVVVAAAGGGVYGVMRLMEIDPVALIGARWEFVLGGALIVILLCLFAFVNLIRRGALVATFVGSLVFLVFLSLAIGVYIAHKFGGFVMWSPEVYYFTEIPNTPDWQAAWGTVFLAIMFSVLGAAVAAAKAADTDPVQALRYE
jgi:lipoprotein-releasing system permease protein